MKRRQLFEWADLPWWLPMFRRLLTDFLQLYVRVIRPYDAYADRMAAAIAATDRVVDLCSGAGGPWPALAEDLRRRTGRALRVTLTDTAPDPEILQRFAGEDGVTFHPDPVDARAVPRDLAGARMLFNALHHFPPDEAQAILQDAVRARQPVLSFDILRRTVRDLIPMIFAWVHVLLLTPWVRPFSWTRLLLTYVFPVAPITIAWEGVVSILRCYTPEELLAMAASVDGGDTYTWSAGADRKAGLFPVTWLVGVPAPRALGQS